MKTLYVVSFLISLLFAAALCIQGQEPVKDTLGDIVQTGEQYFIMPVKSEGNNGDGLFPYPFTVPICPFGIFQGLLPQSSGLPVSFAFPYSTSETIVKTFFDVTIEFKSAVWPFCKDFPNFWGVNETSSDPSKPAILVGGNPEKENSWFQIKDGGEGEGSYTYKLTTFTGTVGAIPPPWLNASQLVLTNDTAKTLLVQFKKFDAPTTISTSTSWAEKLGLIKMLPLYY